jgi:hypothetical protein
MDAERRVTTPAPLPARLLAFYLPQFHPIPENDAAWGPGFTEWTNVVRARPAFPGHRQPRLPADLGFYDLRLDDVRIAQAELAAAAGLSGFVYYHYWFGGRRLLHQPLDRLLATGSPDFPFAICWANENWTRTWDGGDDVLLQRQQHSVEDDEAHARWIATVMRDPRYLTVDGRPLLMVYKPSLLPDPAATNERFRRVLAAEGLPSAYLVMVESTSWERARSPIELGYDASVDFFPDWDSLGRPRHHDRVHGALRRLGLSPRGYGDNRVVDYADVVRRRWQRAPRTTPPRFPVVCPGWDNSPRRRTGALVLHDPSVELYEEWVGRAIDEVARFAPDERLVFVNAWNEWAEGAVLEPSDLDGRAFLDATARAVASRAGASRTVVGGAGSGQQVPVADASG